MYDTLELSLESPRTQGLPENAKSQGQKATASKCGGCLRWTLPHQPWRWKWMFLGPFRHVQKLIKAFYKGSKKFNHTHFSRNCLGTRAWFHDHFSWSNRRPVNWQHLGVQSRRVFLKLRFLGLYSTAFLHRKLGLGGVSELPRGYRVLKLKTVRLFSILNNL